MFCKNCGAEVEDNATVCPSCGQVPGEEEVAPVVETSSFVDAEPFADMNKTEEAVVESVAEPTAEPVVDAQPVQDINNPMPDYNTANTTNTANSVPNGAALPANGYQYGNGTYDANQQYNTAPTGNGEAKSKMAAGLFGIFLGAFGVHNFYLGYTGKAVAQLLITLLSCFILSPVSGIWGLVEGIMILTGSTTTDANGNPLSE